MTYMSKNETKKFLMQGTFTAKLTTVNKDGSPHVVPVWFVLDERKNRTAKKIEVWHSCAGRCNSYRSFPRF